MRVRPFPEPLPAGGEPAGELFLEQEFREFCCKHWRSYERCHRERESEKRDFHSRTTHRSRTTSTRIPSGAFAGGRGRSLWLFLLRLPGFFFLTSVAFGHIGFVG